MKKILVMCLPFAILACAADPNGGGGSTSVSTSSSVVTGETFYGTGGSSGNNVCDLYGPVETELGVAGGDVFLLEIPAECDPFYFEKGRPGDDDKKVTDVGVGPEPFLGQESIDVCVE